MPKIPQYTSERQISGQAPNVMVDARSYGAQGAMLQETGKTIGEFTDALRKVIDLKQTTEAELESIRRLNTLQTSMALDTDLDTILTRSKDEINTIREDSLEKVSLNTGKFKFSTEFEMKAMSAYNNIQKDVIGRTFEKSKSSLFQANDLDKEAYLNSSSGSERQMLLDQMKLRTQQHIDLGVIDQVEGYKYIKSTTEDWLEAQVKSDIDINPEAALTELNKGEKGIYAEVPKETRDELTITAESRLAKLQKEAIRQHKEAQDKNESTMLSLAWDNKLALRDIEDAMLKGQIRNTFASAMKKYIESPHGVSAKTDPNTYDTLMAKILDPNVTAASIRTQILDASADGKLSEKDRRRLLYVKQGANEQSVMEDYLNASKPSVWKTAWEAVQKAFISVGSNIIHLNVMNRVIDRASEPGNGPDAVPKIAAEEIRKQNVEAAPSLISVPKEGEIWEDIYGNRAMVFPDGSIQPIQEEAEETDEEEEAE